MGANRPHKFGTVVDALRCIWICISLGKIAKLGRRALGVRRKSVLVDGGQTVCISPVLGGRQNTASDSDNRVGVGNETTYEILSARSRSS